MIYVETKGKQLSNSQPDQSVGENEVAGSRASQKGGSARGENEGRAYHKSSYNRRTGNGWSNGAEILYLVSEVHWRADIRKPLKHASR